LLLLARKRDIFKKNTIARDMRNRLALRHAQGPYKGTIIPSGYSTPRTQYTRGLHGRLRVIVLFFRLEWSRFQVGNKSKTQRVNSCSAPIQLFLEIKKGVKLNALTHLRLSTACTE